MAMNIEQRLEQSVKSIEQSSQKAHDFAEKDITIQTCAGSRDSLPKVSRIWQENFARQMNQHATEFQDRFSLSQQSLPWQAGITISDSLQRYHVGLQGEEGYKEFLPNPVKLPFETAATLAEDLTQQCWLENGVPNKHWTESKVASSLEKSFGVNARVWPKDRDLQVGDMIPSAQETADGLPITHVIVDGNAYAMSPIANGLVSELKPTSAMIGGVTVKLFNASSNLTLVNPVALAISEALTEKRRINFISNDFDFSSFPDVNDDYIMGETKIGTVLRFVSDGIPLRERSKLGDFTLENTSKIQTGRGIFSRPNLQTAQATIDSLVLKNWRVAIWLRNSIWNRIADTQIKSCVGGIRFARSEYTGNSTNPTPSNQWNAFSNGYFHNVGVVSNVLVSGGEYGVWGCTMCYNFDAITTQNIHADGVTNKELAAGMRGVGLYLDNGREGSAAQSYCNSIRSHYSEDVDIGSYIKDKHFVSIDGDFCQGASSASPAHRDIVVDNSTVFAKGVCGQDWFETIIEAKNNALVVLSGGLFGSIASTQPYKADATSRILARGECDLPITRYSINKPAGVASRNFTLPKTLNNFSKYRITIVGVRDGFARSFGEAIVFYYNLALQAQVFWINDLSPIVAVTTSSNTVTITVTTSTSYEAQIYFEECFSEKTHPTVQSIGGI